MMQAYTEEQRKALTEYARNAIKQAEEARDEIPFGLSEEEEMEISLFAIALERLNAAAPQPVPDGWKLVPVEPTEEMLSAALKFPAQTRKQYAAMLAAAPELTSD